MRGGRDICVEDEGTVCNEMEGGVCDSEREKGKVRMRRNGWDMVRYGACMCMEHVLRDLKKGKRWRERKGYLAKQGCVKAQGGQAVQSTNLGIKYR